MALSDFFGKWIFWLESRVAGKKGVLLGFSCPIALRAWSGIRARARRFERTITSVCFSVSIAPIALCGPVFSCTAIDTDVLNAFEPVVLDWLIGVFSVIPAHLEILSKTLGLWLKSAVAAPWWRLAVASNIRWVLSA